MTRTPPRWVRIVAPVILLGVWLGVSALGGPTFGTISTVVNNDQASYLPASAESTVVQAELKRFFPSDTVPAIVVYARTSGLTGDDRTAVAERVDAISAIAGVGTVVGPIPSTDGQALEVVVPVESNAVAKTVIAAVRSAAVDGIPSGLTSYVTGPAALGVDFGAAFGGIDGILLLVALLAVFVILLVVYRSLLLPILVLLTSTFALTGSILIVYLLAKAGWITVTGQSQGILSILALGAATDYSLLLVARFREALISHRTAWPAMRVALRAAVEPIAASAATVILGVLCLLLSGLNSNRGLGPVAAIAILFALLAALTALPALLLLCGRAAFWPFRPKYVEPVEGVPAVQKTGRLWGAVGGLVSRRPRAVWITSVVLLGAASLGLLQLQANGVPQTDLLLTQADSVDGQKLLAEHFEAGSGSPVYIVTREAEADRVVALAAATDGIADAAVYTGASGAPGGPAAPAKVVDGRVLVEATLSVQADSAAAEKAVTGLRDALPAIDPQAKVGGVTALALDTDITATADLRVIIPAVLLVVLLVLMLLLRSILAPVLLIGTVVLSYAATLGVSALVFNHLFRFPGADPSVPLFGFVFLVALGVDYNIFLMTRVREESLHIGTRPGIVRGVQATGGVITAAGIVLAATFSALQVIPILFLVQISFIVAFGVLLDTILVRSLLVPALSYDIGRRIWWPSKLGRAETTPRSPK
ncbi:MMPL family transporter [Lysinimonas soli]|uniref:MMPL family transporter n=1 Tax=Lysinimonas soli TaxID=1074233 RepID=A0ABW0NKS4_9MICO